MSKKFTGALSLFWPKKKEIGSPMGSPRASSIVKGKSNSKGKSDTMPIIHGIRKDINLFYVGSYSTAVIGASGIPKALYAIHPYAKDNQNRHFAFYALCNGHHGYEAAVWVQKWIFTIFMRKLKDAGELTQAVLSETLLEAQRSFWAEVACKKDGSPVTGSTCLLLVITPKKEILWANMGDSMAYHFTLRHKSPRISCITTTGHEFDSKLGSTTASVAGDSDVLNEVEKDKKGKRIQEDGDAKGKPLKVTSGMFSMDQYEYVILGTKCFWDFMSLQEACKVLQGLPNKDEDVAKQLLLAAMEKAGVVHGKMGVVATFVEAFYEAIADADGGNMPDDSISVRELASSMKEVSIQPNHDDSYDVGRQLGQHIVANDSDDDDADPTSEKGLLLLGFLFDDIEDQASPSGSVDVSKAGGNPRWLDPVHLPSGGSFLCDFCEEPLRFVLQVSAPLCGRDGPVRIIFVFMCPSMHCLCKDQQEQVKCTQERVSRRSVKVFRCQLPTTSPFLASDNKRSHGRANQLGPEDGLCSWCHTWKGGQLCGGCRKVRYCSKSHQRLHWGSGHKSLCKQMILSSQSSSTHLCGGGSAPGGKQTASCKVQWPEYEIDLVEHRREPSFSDLHSSSLVPFESADEKMESMMDEFEGDEDKKSMTSFQLQIANEKAKDQVLRYWTGNGKPVWPLSSGRPSVADIPPCSYCGGPQGFEFQIMPQLLHFFHESEIDSLDWATIAVYTCEASCDSAVVYKQEFPWVQLYT